MDAITLMILYLQEDVDDYNIIYLLHMLTYNTACDIPHLKDGLNNLQDINTDLAAIIIPYIKAINALYCQIIPLLPFEKVFTT